MKVVPLRWISDDAVVNVDQEERGGLVRIYNQEFLFILLVMMAFLRLWNQNPCKQ